MFLDELIYEREFVSPVHGVIIIPELKKNIVFETSPLPQNFNELFSLAYRKTMDFKIKEFDIEIFVGRIFVEVKDDDTYVLVRQHLHNEAGKSTALHELKMRLVLHNADDLVSYLKNI